MNEGVPASGAFGGLKEQQGVIRTATAADAVAIARVHAASWRAAVGRSADPPAGTAAVADWKARLRDMPGSTLLFEVGGELLGFASAGQSRDADAVPGKTAELFALYISPDTWGRGAGRRLWFATRQRLQDEGFAEVRLWVMEANFRARALYERFGFAHENGREREVEFGGDRMPEVRYRMALEKIRRTD
jgi:ribosomal protein S18 acetylase RimI-like enzyme